VPPGDPYALPKGPFPKALGILDAVGAASTFGVHVHARGSGRRINAKDVAVRGVVSRKSHDLIGRQGDGSVSRAFSVGVGRVASPIDVDRIAHQGRGRSEYSGIPASPASATANQRAVFAPHINTSFAAAAPYESPASAPAAADEKSSSSLDAILSRAFGCARILI
jgi:hypothetical protein